MASAPTSSDTPSKLDYFTRLTQTWVQHDTDPETGTVVAHDMPPLLAELREAVFGGMEKTGGTSGFKARLPISDGAHDLYEQIDHEITETWCHLFPNHVPGIETPEQLLAQVVAIAADDEQATITVTEQHIDHPGTLNEHWWVERRLEPFTILHLLRRWVHLINSFFNPERTREIAAPCIQCGKEWEWKLVDGESRRTRVFVFIQDDHGTTTEARCLACGVSWRPDRFAFLAASLGAATPQDS